MTPRTDIEIEIDTDTFEQFAARLGWVEREIPAPPAVGWHRSPRHDRGGLRPIASGLAAFASVGLLVVTIVGSIALRGAAPTPASSPGPAIPAAAAGSDLPTSALAPSSSESPATLGPTTSPTEGAAQSTAPVAGDTNPFDAAVQAMVEDGTIDQHQADVLRQQIDAGSIDSQQLIDGGVLSAAQMQTVNDRLGAIKRSLAPSDPGTAATDKMRLKLAQQQADSAGGQGSKVPSASAAPEMNAAKEAADAAVQALVVDGTIDQHQADVVRQEIDAGSVDEQALVDNGTLTAAQMVVVRTALIAVKQSFASGAEGASPAAPASKDPSTTK